MAEPIFCIFFYCQVQRVALMKVDAILSFRHHRWVLEEKKERRAGKYKTSRPKLKKKKKKDAGMLLLCVDMFVSPFCFYIGKINGGIDCFLSSYVYMLSSHCFRDGRPFRDFCERDPPSHRKRKTPATLLLFIIEENFQFACCCSFFFLLCSARRLVTYG